MTNSGQPDASIISMEAGNEYAAVLLAGGRARRLEGVAKPTLPIAGVPMLHRVLAAVQDAVERVVVGPANVPLPDGVVRTQECPARAGPVAAAAAGLTTLSARPPYVALLAADLPLLTAAAVALLRQEITSPDATTSFDGAVYIDGSGWRQWLCGVWRTTALSEAMAAAAADAPLRQVLGTLRVREVSTGAPLPPWYDCDTEADLRKVEEWIK